MRTIFGGMVGGILLSVLTVMFHWFFFNSTLKDGQYIFVLFIIFPAGTILGAMNGLTFDLLSLNKLSAARIISIGGGSILTFLFLFLGLVALSGSHKMIDRISNTVYLFTFSLIWSLFLIWRGMQIVYGP